MYARIIFSLITILTTISTSHADVTRSQYMRQVASSQTSDVQVVTYRIHRYQNAESAEKVIAQCNNNDVCKVMLTAAELYTGIPFGKISSAVETIFPYSAIGETTDWEIYAPDGYLVCEVSIEHLSVAPADGKQTSAFNIDANTDTVHVRTYTHEHKIFGAGTWYDGLLHVTYLSWDVLDNSWCSIKGIPKCFTCRGSTSNTHGAPVCSGTHVLNEQIKECSSRR